VWALSNLSLNDENNSILVQSAPRIADMLLAEKRALDGGHQSAPRIDKLLMCMRAILNLALYPANHTAILDTGMYQYSPPGR
jgi:hypothetical protein